MNSKTALLCSITAVLTLGCFVGICRAEPSMVEKNLFSEGRKPTTDEEPAPENAGRRPAQTGLPPRSVQLDGVFIRDNARKALVRVSSQLLGEPKSRVRGRGPADQFPYMTISEGEAIGDFKVIKIDSRSVSLEKDKQVYEIGLFMDGKVVPPATPLPAGPISPEPVASPNGPAAEPTPEQLQQAGQQPGRQRVPPAPQAPGDINQLAIPPPPPQSAPVAPQPPVQPQNPTAPLTQ